MYTVHSGTLLHKTMNLLKQLTKRMNRTENPYGKKIKKIT